MRTIALTLVFVLNLFPTNSRAEIDEGTELYPLPEVLLNELWWELDMIEGSRIRNCPNVTTEEELDLALEEVDTYIEKMIQNHYMIQGRIMQVHRACTVAPERYQNNIEVDLAAEELYNSSNWVALLVSDMTHSLEAEWGMLQYLHQPLPGFSSSSLELQFLCNNAHGQLHDMVKREAYDLHQILAPYTIEVLQFFQLLETYDLIPPAEEEPRRKPQRPNMVEYEPYSAPA